MLLFYKYTEDMGIKDQKFKNCLKKKLLLLLLKRKNKFVSYSVIQYCIY